MSISKSLRRFLYLAATLALLILIPISPVAAAPGDLDSTFGGPPQGPAVGKVQSDFGPLYNDFALAMVMQPDGKIVLGGTSGPEGDAGQFALARYNADGSLDASFSADGKVRTNIVNGAEYVLALALQADGKIVAAGYSDGSTGRDVTVARYNADGTLDTTFNGSGSRVLSISPGNDEAKAVAITPDGKIVLAGYRHNGVDNDFAVVRLNANGGSDGGFGVGGVVNIALTAASDGANGVLVEPDNKIVVMGHGGQDFAIARLTATGVLDSSFNSTGKRLTAFGVGSEAFALLRQPDGKFLAGGYAGHDFALVRYTSAGLLDSTFGIGGKLLTDFDGSFNNLIFALALSGNGKIVAAGSGGQFGGGHLKLARYSANGTLDNTFGGTGKVSTDTSDQARAVAALPGGKILVGGVQAGGPGSYDFALVSFNDDGSLDGGFGRAGRVRTDFGTTGDAINAITRQVGGKLVVAGVHLIGLSGRFVVARYSEEGVLDNTFGAGGRVITGIGATASAAAVAMTSNGAIVVAGYGIGGGQFANVALVRYGSGGDPDPSFGSGGIVTTDLGGSEYGTALAIRPDGKILVAGNTNAGGSGKFLLVRYLANGSPDASFGANGVVTTGFAGDAGAVAMTVLADGKIVLAGSSKNGANSDFALARYTANGVLDGAFGSGGKLTTSFGASTAATSLAALSDGRLVVAGELASADNPDLALARYRSDGTLDPSFGSGGKVVSNSANIAERSPKIATLADDRLAVAWTTGGDFAAAIYDVDGSRSSNFGADGTAVVDFNDGADSVRALLVQPDSKIVLAGSVDNVSGTLDFGLARFQAPAPQVDTTPTATATPMPCNASFSDVQASDYFYTPVLYLACNGTISGYGDGTFRPFNNTTRGQLAKIIVGAAGWQIDTTGGPHFIDVPSGHTFYPSIETAYKHGAISGYGDGTFKPGNNVTRGQLSKIIVSAAGWPLVNPASASFSDVAVGSTFYQQIETAAAHGIISGYDVAGGKEFRPGNNATRGQISKIVYGAIAVSTLSGEPLKPQQDAPQRDK